jgi:PTS system mannitol-specific IIC component
VTDTKSNGGFRVGVQKFGTFLSGMVMPNIAAFIACLNFLALVGPMIVNLLPLLIANTGGRLVYGARGGVVASIATMGVIVGTTIPQFMGAMIVGPIAAWIMKKVDSIWEGKIKAGFEMLVDNFSAGIVGGALALVAFLGMSPIVTAISDTLGKAVEWLVSTGFLPGASLLIEPAKVLFLNNAINHGVLTPLGTTAAAESGKSILFLLEANPGPGLGILAAFALFGVGLSKASAPGAILIHFFGGIHEVYFPYILMKPALIVAAIAGGATGVATNMIFGSGLRAPASPGSIVAVLIQTASDSYIGVILSVVLSATVSFLIAGVIIRATRSRDLASDENGAFSDAQVQSKANKGK